MERDGARRTRAARKDKEVIRGKRSTYDAGNPAGGSQCNSERDRRHGDGVVRLLPVRHGCGDAVQPSVLPQVRPPDGHAARVRELCDRLYRAARWQRHFRASRRPHRTQGRIDHHAAADGRLDHVDGPLADVCGRRRMGAAAAMRAARGARSRLGRRVRGRGADGDRVRAREAARPVWLAALYGRRARPADVARDLPHFIVDVARKLRGLGLAHSVPAQCRGRGDGSAVAQPAQGNARVRGIAP